jgi:uncharacterized protein with HEPN domain
VSRSERERFADILEAIQRCNQYAPHLRSDDLASMAYDAGLRNIVVHEYFRVNPDLILDIVNHQLVDRASAIRIRMTSAGPSCRYQGGRLAAMTQPA